MSSITWLSGGNYNLEQCKNEDELVKRLNEIFENLSEQVGEVRYRTDNGRQYVIGITMNVIEIEEDEGDGGDYEECDSPITILN
jgi:hypothetical protein